MENDITEELWQEIENLTGKTDDNQSIELSKTRIPKCSTSEYETRVTEVIDMLTHFETQPAIRKFLGEKYGLQPISCKIYIDEANHRIIDNIPGTKEILGKHIEIYKRIIKRNENDDARTSLIAMNSLEKLLHMHQPEIQLNQQTNNISFEGIDIQDIMEYLKSLKDDKSESPDKLEAK